MTKHRPGAGKLDRRITIQRSTAGVDPLNEEILKVLSSSALGPVTDLHPLSADHVAKRRGEVKAHAAPPHGDQRRKEHYHDGPGYPLPGA